MIFKIYPLTSRANAQVGLLVGKKTATFKLTVDSVSVWPDDMPYA
jgi:hypothetical protein